MKRRDFVTGAAVAVGALTLPALGWDHNATPI